MFESCRAHQLNSCRRESQTPNPTSAADTTSHVASWSAGDQSGLPVERRHHTVERHSQTLVDIGEERAAEPSESPRGMEPDERGGKHNLEAHEHTGQRPNGHGHFSENDCDRRGEHGRELQLVAPGRRKPSGSVVECRLEEDRRRDDHCQTPERSRPFPHPERQAKQDQKQRRVVRQQPTGRVERRCCEATTFAQCEHVVTGREHPCRQPRSVPGANDQLVSDSRDNDWST